MKSPQPQTHVLAALTGSNLNLFDIIDSQKYSSLNCLLRVTARVLRFVEVARGRTLDGLSTQYDCALDATELNRTKVLWIRFIQLAHLKGSTTSGKPPYVDQFGLFIDDQNLL